MRHLRFFIHCVANHQKIERGRFGGKKSHNAEKLKGGPFGIFQHTFCRKTPKNEVGPFRGIFRKKYNNAKNWKGDPLDSSMYVTRKKIKTFLVKFRGPTGTIL